MIRSQPDADGSEGGAQHTALLSSLGSTGEAPTALPTALPPPLCSTDGEVDPSVLGPGTGLIPVFWSEALAVQTSSGKQRKVGSSPG